MKTAIYIRTSTTEQDPENQLKQCLEINSYGDYILFKEQQSAWKDTERPEFEKIRSLIKKKALSHLICWDFDRLYRNRNKLIAFFKLCKAYGCKIHSYRQQWFENLNKIEPPFDEMMHDFMLQMMGWLAEEESSKKSQRVKAAIKTNSKGQTISRLGNKWGRKALSTFKVNKIMEYHAQGLSMAKIAEQVGCSKGVVHKKIHENKALPWCNI